MNQELLQAISDMMDEKLKPVYGRFDGMDARLDSMDARLDGMDARFHKMEGRMKILEYKQNRTSRKLDDLILDVKIAQRNTNDEIHKLQDGMDTVIELLKIHKIVQF